MALFGLHALRVGALKCHICLPAFFRPYQNGEVFFCSKLRDADAVGGNGDWGWC